MNPEFKPQDVMIFVNGEQITTAESIEVKIEKPLVNQMRCVSFGNKFQTIELTNVTFYPAFYETFMTGQEKFDIVGTGIKLPRGNRMPKRKRIQKKWRKKYARKFEILNCTFKGGSIYAEGKDRAGN